MFSVGPRSLQAHKVARLLVRWLITMVDYRCSNFKSVLCRSTHDEIEDVVNYKKYKYSERLRTAGDEDFLEALPKHIRCSFDDSTLMCQVLDARILSW